MGRHRILLACTLALAANTAAAQAVGGDRSKALEGRWTLELVLDSDVRGAPAARQVTGEIAFGTGSWWGNTDRFGRHDVDLRPFFGRTFAKPLDVKAFSAADTSMLTEVSGTIARDSVVVDFIPRLDRWGISLSGRFFGDSARGRWHRRGTDGSGHFVLRRVSKEAVEVAAIPVPKPIRSSVTTTVAATTPAKGKGKTSEAAPAKGASRALAQTATAAPARTPATTRAATSATTPAVTTALSTSAATGSPSRPVANPAPEPAATRSTAVTATAAPAPTPAPAGAAAGAAAATPSPAPSPTVPTITVVPNRELGPTGAAAATGALRVRMFDRASKQWFVTKYSVQLPDKRWMYGRLRTGKAPEGWGTVVARRDPGVHTIEVADFMCGDKVWFFARKIVQPVEVRAGETTDVTIEVDLTAIPAKKSLDNKAGAQCAAPPGVPR